MTPWECPPLYKGDIYYNEVFYIDENYSAGKILSKFLNVFYKCFKEKKKLKNIIAFFKKLNNLKYSQNLYQIVLFAIRINYYSKKEDYEDFEYIENCFDLDFFEIIKVFNNYFEFLEQIYKPYEEELESLTKNKNDLYYENIIDKLSDFLMSKEFIHLLFFSKEIEIEEKKSFDILYVLIFIVRLIDSFEKNLFIKCLFPLLEKLKIKHFENQLKAIKDIRNMCLENYAKNNSLNIEKISGFNKIKILSKLFDNIIKKNYSEKKDFFARRETKAFILSAMIIILLCF